MDAPFPTGMTSCIEKFFREVHPTLKPGQDIYQEVFDTDLFFPLQRQAELVWMIRQARKVQPKVVMELGADKGGGLYHWCQCLPTVNRVIASEIRGTPYEKEFEKAFPDKCFLWIRQSLDGFGPRMVETAVKTGLPGIEICHPSGVVERKPTWKKGGIDVLFIDGDKSAFLADFDAYLPLMSPTGVVFMHDINEQGSPMLRAFETVAARGYRVEKYIDTSDTARALNREQHGFTPRNSHEGWLRHWKGRSCGVGAIWMEGRKA